ncbi:hypothetical protein P691DRAFT_774976 [Macrolepiota fuliginosa MF-IS2]|uniref:F-box domain-containing protein n=1 Tax=Macrolepiota fuliginosa MF-IS2 TaxID=1400762 RepID=A0A9P5XES6_9AGAR|nr:hypothetical protein P691DRAFT_774976 [Macrolepiota fuliginosa MF-IS2]
MAKFKDLPNDIIYVLYQHLRPLDFLALNQTSRELHALGCTAYAWQQLRVDIPLNVDYHQNESVSVLRRVLLQSLKIDANWKSESTRIQKGSRFPHGDFIYFVHLLRDDLLFTISRDTWSELAYLSAWKLGSAKSAPRRLGKIEPKHQGISLLPTRFSAAKHTDEDRVVIAMFTDERRNGYLQSFSLSLRPEDLRPDAPYPAFDLEDSIDVTARPDLLAQIHDVQIYNTIIAASYTEFSEQTNAPQYYELIILDIENQHARTINIGSKEDLAGDKFVFKLFPDSILIITSGKNDGSAAIYDLQDIMNSSSPANTPFSATHNTIHGTKSLRTRYISEFFSSEYSVYLPVEAMSSIPSAITAVAVNNINGASHALYIPIPRNKPTKPDTPLRRLNPHARLMMKAAAHLDCVHIGPAGRRMVWMEIVTEGNDIRIMKATLPVPGEEEVVVSQLLRDDDLPFKYSDCLSLWLDERHGRICISLLDQAICILDF